MPYKNLEDKKEWYQINKVRVWEQQRRYFVKYPWAKTLSAITSRCSGKMHHYFKKGIKNFLTVKDIKFLWFRDNAYSLRKASIDRLDSNGNYTIDNCRFIELTENRPKRRINQCS